MWRNSLQGVEENETKAFELYEKAAMRGSSMAMHRLGQCYEHGKVPTNHT
jgi:TPR repeat protein